MSHSIGLLNIPLTSVPIPKRRTTNWEASVFRVRFNDARSEHSHFSFENSITNSSLGHCAKSKNLTHQIYEQRDTNFNMVKYNIWRRWMKKSLDDPNKTWTLNIGTPRVDEMIGTIKGREMLNPNIDERNSESNWREPRQKSNFNILCKTDNKNTFVLCEIKHSFHSKSNSRILSPYFLAIQ